jgi:hypothetical protein
VVRISDNVTINASSGTANVASDDVGGVQYQNVKIDVGGNGLSVPLSSSNPLPVTASTVNTSITNGRTVTVSANVAVLLASSTVVKEVIITAELDNTGVVVVGGSGVVSTLATRTGVPLNAGDSVSFQITNLNAINIAAVVATDGVTFMAFS